jgi:glucose-1-phosphate adenylyltransferase
MGIYLFKRETLLELLTKDPREDFGKHLIPNLVGMKRAAAFLYEGYWEDIGTIETFFQANIALTDPKPFFSFHNEKRPIFTCPNDLPPAKILETQITKTILCDGAVIEASELTHTIVGPRSVIHKGTIIRDSYLIGNDYYESGLSGKHRLPFHPRIGENCILSRTIIDKNVVLGKGVQLINKQKLNHYDGENIFIRDGIIIVPRGAIIPDGFIL